MIARNSRILSLWLLLGIGASDLGHTQDRFQAGVSVHVGQKRNSLKDTIAALSNGGLTFRDEVLWSHLEGRDGATTFPAAFNDLDELVTDAARRHKPPIIILDYGNNLYDGGDMITSPEGIAAFCRYAAFVVKHFQGRVTQFEVWNEWNIGMGTHPLKPRSPESYVNLLQAAYKAIKSANPAATVIGGVVNGVDLNWVDAFGRAGGFSSLDAFSVHPYEFWYAKAPKSPADLHTTAREAVRAVGGLVAGAVRTANGQTAFQPVPGTPEAAFAKLDALKAKIDQFAPGKNIRVFITEMGWPTNEGAFGIPEASAAAYLQRFYLLGRSRPWVAGIWWYDLFDDGDDATNKENRYGLLYHKGDAKPTYQALLALRDVLESPAAFTNSVATDGTVVVSGTLSNGKSVKVIWLATNDFKRQQSSPEAAGPISAVPTILAQK
jgi:polysaccharide biosynthesis protein PslG